MKPILVIDREYYIDDSNNGERSSRCYFDKVNVDKNYSEYKEKPVLLITSQSDPGITLNKYKEVLINSGFSGRIDKCALLRSSRTLDTDLKYFLHTYEPTTKCRRFPWEKKNPNKMNEPTVHRR